jgi:CubicO group peptidase (beta-lactamase class C family)
MSRWKAISLFLAVALVVNTSIRAHAQDSGDAARREHVKALEALMGSSGDEPLQQFATVHLAPDYRGSFAPDKLLEHLRAVRAAAPRPGGLMVRPGDDGSVHVQFMTMSGQASVVFKMEPAAPYLITSLEVESTKPVDAGAQAAPITWETLASRMDEEAKAGFSGFVYAVHGGHTVLSRGYGFADRAKQTPIDANTIFGIGSTPIDFTRAAVLKLEETGKLKTSDPITKYLKNVPADKQAITIDELMNDTSGLPNFHNVPGTDTDSDLSWIDRDEALRRMMGEQLLFAPGQGQAHSHSAWVLLAIIVETVSGQSYGDFLQKSIFAPAGMTRTFLHEGLAAIPDEQVATGYGAQSSGEVNSPKYWGRTSWLVMGSGGMVSTPVDLSRFITAVQTGKLLAPAQTQKFGAGRGVMVGGDMHGFMCLHAERGDDMVVMCSNVHSGPGDHTSSIGLQLGQMVAGPPPGR